MIYNIYKNKKTQYNVFFLFLYCYIQCKQLKIYKKDNISYKKVVEKNYK